VWGLVGELKWLREVWLGEVKGETVKSPNAIHCEPQ